MTIEIISGIFIVTGVFFTFTGSLGLLRMPDFYTRIHPSGVTDSLGAPLILIGVAILNGFSLFSLKIFLLILFLLITGPTSTHAVAKSAMVSGLKHFTKKKK